MDGRNDVWWRLELWSFARWNLAQLIGSEQLVRTYVRTRRLLMAVRLKRVVTRACRTEIDVKQNVQTHIPLCVLPVYVFPLRAHKLRQRVPIILRCTSKLRFITCVRCMFSIYQPGRSICFSLPEWINTWTSPEGNNLRSVCIPHCWMSQQILLPLQLLQARWIIGNELLFEP